MNLYLLTQSVNNGYDTYDSIIVCEENEEKAKLINPSGPNFNLDGTVTPDFGKDKGVKREIDKWDIDSWCHPKDVEVKLIGKAEEYIKKGIVLASFNAG